MKRIILTLGFFIGLSHGYAQDTAQDTATWEFTPRYEYTAHIPTQTFSIEFPSSVCYGKSIAPNPNWFYRNTSTTGDYNLYAQTVEVTYHSDDHFISPAVDLSNITEPVTFYIIVKIRARYEKFGGSPFFEEDVYLSSKKSFTVTPYNKTILGANIGVAVNGIMKDTYSLPNGELTKLEVVPATEDIDDLEGANYSFDMIYNPTNSVYNSSSRSITKQFFYLEGDYTARINITDKNGCYVGEFFKENFITVQPEQITDIK